MNRITRTIAIATLGVACTIGGVTATHAASDDVCAGLTTGKIDTPSGPATVTVTAPAGKLVSGYCVKAGSENNGNGPVYVTVDPPQPSVTFGYPGGKDISHYSATFVDIPEETTPTVPQTTVPEETSTTAATTVVTEETTPTSAPEELVPTTAATTTAEVASEGPAPTSAVLSATAQQLPTTGSRSTGTLLLGGGAVLAGLALVRFTRRPTSV